MNRKLKCIIVEDESIGIKLIEAFVKKIPYMECDGSFGDAFAALDYLQLNKVDILITDIQMPGMTGLDMVRSMPSPPAIILITAYRDFAPEGFDINAIDYLVKPINFDRFEKAITRAKDQVCARIENQNYPKPSIDFLFVKNNTGHLKISLEDIAYIEANGDYANVCKKDNTKLIMRTTMIDIERKLPVSQFIRVHKSYIVNISSIYLVQNSFIELSDKTEIPLSKNYKALVNERIGV